MVRLILITLLCLQLVPQTTLAAKTKEVDCADPESGDAFKAVIKTVKKSKKTLDQQMKKSGVHMLDLTDESHSASKALVRNLKERDWCSAFLAARVIEDDLGLTRVHEEFVNVKFARVERWVRASELSKSKRTTAERTLATAASKISEGDHDTANKQLNKVINTVFGTRGLWDIPDELPQADIEEDGGARADISESDIEDGCPKLAEKGRGSKSDLNQVQSKLRRAMNDRKIRASDFKGGEAMVEDLANYIRLRATWPAIRVACAMLGQANAVEVDLGFAMARFHRVNKLRRANELDETTEKEFRSLVRASSESISQTDYARAHESLEDLFVLLGEPKKPAGTLK